MKNKKLSQLHDDIKELIDERSRLEAIVFRKSIMAAGSFYRKKNGACYLSASIDGESRHRYVRKSEEKCWTERAEEWRKYSKAVTKWISINKTIERHYREIGRLRCTSLPRGERIDNS